MFLAFLDVVWRHHVLALPEIQVGESFSLSGGVDGLGLCFELFHGFFELALRVRSLLFKFSVDIYAMALPINQGSLLYFILELVSGCLSKRFLKIELLRALQIFDILNRVDQWHLLWFLILPKLRAITFLFKLFAGSQVVCPGGQHVLDVDVDGDALSGRLRWLQSLLEVFGWIDVGLDGTLFGWMGLFLGEGILEIPEVEHLGVGLGVLILSLPLPEELGVDSYSWMMNFLIVLLPGDIGLLAFLDDIGDCGIFIGEQARVLAFVVFLGVHCKFESFVFNCYY